jgi:hypothetical protein
MSALRATPRATTAATGASSFAATLAAPTAFFPVSKSHFPLGIGTAMSRFSPRVPAPASESVTVRLCWLAGAPAACGCVCDCAAPPPPNGRAAYTYPALAAVRRALALPLQPPGAQLPALGGRDGADLRAPRCRRQGRRTWRPVQPGAAERCKDQRKAHDGPAPLQTPLACAPGAPALGSHVQACSPVGTALERCM